MWSSLKIKIFFVKVFVRTDTTNTFSRFNWEYTDIYAAD